MFEFLDYRVMDAKYVWLGWVGVVILFSAAAIPFLLPQYLSIGLILFVISGGIIISVNLVNRSRRRDAS